MTFQHFLTGRSLQKTGQAELDKRRRALAEQQRREQEDRERKEREEYERKEKLRLEQERRLQAEMEKKLAKQREIEMVIRSDFRKVHIIQNSTNRKRKNNEESCSSNEKQLEKKWNDRDSWSGRSKGFRSFFNRNQKSRKKLPSCVLTT